MGALTRDDCKRIRDQLNEVLQKMDPAMSVDVGRATFNSFSVTFKVTVTPGGDAAKADKEKSDFAMFCRSYGLTPEHYGAIVKAPDGRTFTLFGFATRRSKRPVLARAPDGREYAFPLVQTLNLLGLKEEAAKRKSFGFV